MSETTHENIGQELANLRRQLSELRNQVEKHYNEVLDWKAKRDEFNKSMGQLVAKLKEERELRRLANEKVAELKGFTLGFNKELEEREALIDELEAKKKESLVSVKDDPEYVRERIRRLEWYLQTNVLPLDRENVVVKEITSLEKKLQGAKVVDVIETQLSQVVGQARSIGNKANEYRNQMLEHVRNSQSHHAAIIELGKKATDMKKEADSAHQRYIELFGLASQSLSDSRKIQDRIGELSDKMRLEQEGKKTYRTDDRREKIEKVAAQAFEKVKKGDRITMDKLSVLVEKGYFNESERPP